jgi:hypothetical protein
MILDRHYARLRKASKVRCMRQNEIPVEFIFDGVVSNFY